MRVGLLSSDVNKLSPFVRHLSAVSVDFERYQEDLSTVEERNSATLTACTIRR